MTKLLSKYHFYEKQLYITYNNIFHLFVYHWSIQILHISIIGEQNGYVYNLCIKSLYT